jgi:hypothetical protein
MCPEAGESHPALLCRIKDSLRSANVALTESNDDVGTKRVAVAFERTSDDNDAIESISDHIMTMLRYKYDTPELYKVCIFADEFVADSDTLLLVVRI